MPLTLPSHPPFVRATSSLSDTLTHTHRGRGESGSGRFYLFSVLCRAAGRPERNERQHHRRSNSSICVLCRGEERRGIRAMRFPEEKRSEACPQLVSSGLLCSALVWRRSCSSPLGPNAIPSHPIPSRTLNWPCPRASAQLISYYLVSVLVACGCWTCEQSREEQSAAQHTPAPLHLPLSVRVLAIRSLIWCALL